MMTSNIYLLNYIQYVLKVIILLTTVPMKSNNDNKAKMYKVPVKDPLNQKFLNKVLKKCSEGRINKVEAGRLLGVTRKTIYSWLEDYINKPTIYKAIDIEKEIIRIIIANPAFGPARISRKLSLEGYKLSVRSVWQALKKLNMASTREREIYSLNFRKCNQAKDSGFPKIIRFTPVARKRIIEELVLQGKKVTDLSKTYKLSRRTIVKWKKRYQFADTHGQNLLFAVSDQHPTGSLHPRGVKEESVNKILDLIVTKPILSAHKIAKTLGMGNHGVQNVLMRYNLNKYEYRQAYSRNRGTEVATEPAYTDIFGKIKNVWEGLVPNLLAAPPPSVFKNFISSSSISFIVFLGLFKLASVLTQAPNVVTGIGYFFALIALTMGMFFFLYSLKYYLTLAIVLSYSQQGGGLANLGSMKKTGLLSWILGNKDTSNTKALGLEANLDAVTLKDKPFVSVHVGLYNEKNVVERLSKALASFDYSNYEVILADDSTDETSSKITEFQKKYLFKGEQLKITHGEGWTLTEVEVKPGVLFKHLHRTTRSGFKGGALALALKLTNPKAERISIFDADFVPYPDTLTSFLKYFQIQKDSKVAAVQGYQWHVLNKSENWITRGVRSEYSGSYVIERAGAEIYGGLKQISGAVYMIKKSVLSQIGWGTSITEDFELTLKLYDAGYKVAYTPYIQAPAECVSTIKRMVRQRMRWAEGHSFNIKKMFKKLMTNPNLTGAEKFEFLYLSPYYLQAFFFLIGTICWLISETVLRVKLPFWTELWGWSLVLTNMISLPLLNAVGLFLEESEQKDYSGIPSFIALSYIVVPFQAYAALKGFFEKEEGGWFRTPKTGRITDTFTRGKFMRFIQGILPGRTPVLEENYLILTTANNRFDKPLHFRKADLGKLMRRQIFSKVTLCLVLVFTITMNYLSLPFSKVVEPVAAQETENGPTKLTAETPANSVPQKEYDPELTVIEEGSEFVIKGYLDSDNMVMFAKDKVRIIGASAKYLDLTFKDSLGTPQIEGTRGVFYEIAQGTVSFDLNASELHPEIKLFEQYEGNYFDFGIDYSEGISIRQADSKGYQVIDNSKKEILFYIQKPEDGNFFLTDKTVSLKPGNDYPQTLTFDIKTNSPSPFFNIADKTNDPTSRYKYEVQLPKGGGEILLGKKSDNSIGYKFTTGDDLYNMEMKMKGSATTNVVLDGNKVIFDTANIKTVYEIWTDRVKADYILKSKPVTNIIDFTLTNYSMIPETNDDGSIAFIGDDGYGDPNGREVYKLDVPNIIDNNGVEGSIKYEISKSLTPTTLVPTYCKAKDSDCKEPNSYYDRSGTISLILDQNYLNFAVYPIKIDPTVIDNTAGVNATAYGSQRHLVRMANGTLAAFYSYNSAGILRPAYALSFDDGITWVIYQDANVSANNVALATMNNELHRVTENSNPNVIYTPMGGDIAFKVCRNNDSCATVDQSQTDIGGQTAYLDNSAAGSARIMTQSFIPSGNISITDLQVYVSAKTGTPTLNLELRNSKNNGREPDMTSTLASCSTSSLTAGAYNGCNIGTVNLTSGTTYFIDMYCTTSCATSSKDIQIETRQPSGSDYTNGYSLFSLEWTIGNNNPNNYVLNNQGGPSALDNSNSAKRPSIVIDKNNYPAVAWSFETSGGTKNAGVRFSRATGDPQTATNWKCATGSSCTTFVASGATGDHIQPVAGTNSASHPVIVKAPSTATNADELVIFALWNSTTDMYSMTSTVNDANYYAWTTTNRETTIDAISLNLSALSVDDGTNQRIWVSWDDDVDPTIRLSYLNADDNTWTASPTNTPQLTGNSPSLAYDAQNGDIFVWAIDQSTETQIIFRKYKINNSTWDSADQLFD